MGPSLVSLWATKSEMIVNLQSLGTGSGTGKGARRAGASVLQGVIHLGPLSPMPDLLYMLLPSTALPSWERCGTGLFLARSVTTTEHLLCLLLQELLPPAIL